MPGPARGAGIVVGPQARSRCGAWRREAPADGRRGRGISRLRLIDVLALRTAVVPEDRRPAVGERPRLDVGPTVEQRGPARVAAPDVVEGRPGAELCDPGD